MRVIEKLLIAVESVMHIPESVLRPRRLSCFGRDLRPRMHCGQREVSKRKAQFFTQAPAKLADDAVRGGAKGTLVVAVLDQRHWGANRTENVVA